MTFENGVNFVTKRKRRTLGWIPRQKSDVIAIDFGTSTLAVAYKRKEAVHPVKLQGADCIPAVLLIKTDKKTRKTEAEIGIVALNHYCRLEVIETHDIIFFERVKLQLKDSQTIDRTTSIEGSDCKKYYVLQVIGLILENVKRCVEKEFTGFHYKLSDFDWIVTVPASWGQNARDMMREAAYLAGLCSESPKLTEFLQLPLSPVGKCSLPSSLKMFEENPHRVSLVLEPDAAAVWCNQLTPEITASSSTDRPLMKAGDSFITVDVGGGTIDVTAHEVLEDRRYKMKRINVPHGEIFGGATINEAFRMCLATEVVEDNGFREFIGDDENEENKAELHDIIFNEFEATKKGFGNADAQQDCYVLDHVPSSFVGTYWNSFRKLGKKKLDSNEPEQNPPTYELKRRSKLYISSAKMASFFDEGCTKIVDCIDKAAKEVSNLKMLYLVGGFGGCQYIRKKIIDHYSGQGLKVIVPRDFLLAIVQGACKYHEQNIVYTADGTYGIETSVVYDDENPVHKMAETFTEDGNTYCKNVFAPFIQVGDEMKEEYVYSTFYSPTKNSQEMMSFPVYTSPSKRYVHFTRTANKVHPELKLSAMINIDVSEESTIPKDQRIVEVVFDFSSAEVMIYAHFLDSQKVILASMDFLTTLDSLQLMSE